jgi:hypothetical protein
VIQEQSVPFSLARRSALFIAVAILSLVAIIVLSSLEPHTGAIEGVANPYYILFRMGLMLVYALLGWQWIVRPSSGDRASAWIPVGVATGLFGIAMISANTTLINRLFELDSHSRSVLPRTYTFTYTKGGRSTPRRTSTEYGVLFADEQNHEIERVPWTNGITGESTACFIDHHGWLGQHWMSNEHDCDQPPEHIQLLRLRVSSEGLIDNPGPQCIDGNPDSSPLNQPVDVRCPSIVYQQGQKVLIAAGVPANVLAPLPFPANYWEDPQVIAISPDHEHILISDFTMPVRLFLWNGKDSRWSALQLPFIHRFLHNRYALNDDGQTIFDCPEGLQTLCERWVLPD